MRALEVCIHTQKPYSGFRKKEKKERSFNNINLLINTDREALYSKINQRVDIMMEQGLLDEVKQLYPYKHLNALNTVGYKELFDYLGLHYRLQIIGYNFLSTLLAYLK